MAGGLVAQQSSFVKTQSGQFTIDGHPYYYIGANYWYGGLEAHLAQGKKRIIQELDFLQKQGVNNLRVLAGAEGAGQINGVPRVEPALQTAPGIFNESLLTGLDFLLVEMAKRNMKAVIYFSNNWEWSGGFLQYLNWNGMISDSVLQRKLSWDEMRDYVQLFYSNESCVNQYLQQVKLLIQRVNSISHQKYTDDPAIMAWEIANEPRPMRPAAIEAYKKFIANTAAFIKKTDSNHLLTIGSEGLMGSENMQVFETVHADKNIDYATIHIWPKNWGWFKDTSIAKSFEEVIEKTASYITSHAAATKALGKPMVIEEFGLPRDSHSFSTTSSTFFRDRYYTSVFEKLAASAQVNGNIAGANFWAFSGKGRPSYKQLLWKKGDDVLGDPPVEEQGLNSVFDIDKSTWTVISVYTKKLEGHK
jgi:mannan endo-1,4-beta-mannosidase